MTEKELKELKKYQKHQKDFKCKNCKNIQRQDNGVFFCNVRSSFYTWNLKLNIKANDIACPLYEPKDKF